MKVVSECRKNSKRKERIENFLCGFGRMKKKNVIRMLSIIAAASIGVTPLGNPLTVCAKPAVVENGIDSTQSSDAKEEKSEEKEALERSDESSDDFFSGTPGSDANETEEKQNADSETVNEKTKEEAVSERTDEKVDVAFRVTNPRWKEIGNISPVNGEGVKESPVEAKNFEDAIKEAGTYLSDAMQDINEGIILSFGDYDILADIDVVDGDEDKYGKLAEGEDLQHVKFLYLLLDAAFAHTENNPEKGDFLRGEFVSADYHYEKTEDGFVLELTDIDYLSDLHAQSYLDKTIDELFAQNNVDKMSQYEKARFVYSYLIDNINYEEGSNFHSAYEAMKRRESSSYGRVSLAYYMLNKAGVDTRIISGDGQEWLIVEMFGKYFNIDPIADADVPEFIDASYFLKGSETFGRLHTPDWQFNTDSFRAQYPISESDYELSTVTLDRLEAKMSVGDRIILRATSSDGSPVTFSSSDNEIASVTQTGEVTALKDGEAVITAKNSEGAAECKITVVSPHEVSVTSKDNVTSYVSGSGEYLTGDPVTITAIKETRDGYRFTHWELPDDLEYLDGATNHDYRLSFYMPSLKVDAVAVYEKIPVEVIYIEDKEFTMKTGEEKELEYVLEPSNAYAGDIEIVSSDEEVVKILENGKLSAVANGTAKVTISSGDVKTVCTVKVTGDEYKIEVTGRDSKGKVKTQSREVAAGDVMTISVPDVTKYGYRFVEWETVPKNLEYKDGYGKDTIKTSFVMPEEDLSMTAKYDEILVETINLRTKNIVLQKGRTYRLNSDVSVVPANALNKKIKYESDDTSVATADDNGKVTAVGEGTTEIILTCGDGRAVCEVTVKGNDTVTSSGNETLDIKAQNVKLYVGSYYTLSVNKKNVAEVTFSSSDNKVATVTSSGKITGIGAGTCTITAVSSSGKTRDTVNVTVVEKTDQHGTVAETEDKFLKYKADAAIFRANADKMRADAMRQGVTNGKVDVPVETPEVSTGGIVEQVAAGGTNESSKDVSSHPTGDSSHIAFWGVLAAAVTALGGSICFKNRKNKKKRESSEEKVYPDGKEKTER